MTSGRVRGAVRLVRVCYVSNSVPQAGQVPVRKGRGVRGGRNDRRNRLHGWHIRSPGGRDDAPDHRRRPHPPEHGMSGLCGMDHHQLRTSSKDQRGGKPGDCEGRHRRTLKKQVHRVPLSGSESFETITRGCDERALPKKRGRLAGVANGPRPQWIMVSNNRVTERGCKPGTAMTLCGT